MRVRRTADGKDHFWEAKTGKFKEVKMNEDEMDARLAGMLLKKSTTMAALAAETKPAAIKWLNGTFICTCAPDSCVKFLCDHLDLFYKNCNDVGRGMCKPPYNGEGNWTIKVPARGSIYVPLAGGVQLVCPVEARPHWSGSDGRQILAVTINHVDNEGIFLEPDDGLIKLIGYARGIVSSFAQFEYAMEKLNERRRVPCRSERHGNADDVSLVRRIKAMASNRLGSTPKTADALKDWDTGYLEPVLFEIALEEAYASFVNGTCFACDSKKIDVSNMPDDLVPTF